MKEEYLLPYLAGVFDGEGTVTIINHRKLYCRRVNPSVNLRIAVVMTDEQIPTLFSVVFGGTIKNYSRNGHPKWKSVWLWGENSSQAVDVLKQLLPYLILKKPQALLAIEFMENYHPQKGGGKPLPPEEFATRLKFSKEMSRLNRKGN